MDKATEEFFEMWKIIKREYGDKYPGDMSIHIFNRYLTLVYIVEKAEIIKMITPILKANPFPDMADILKLESSIKGLCQ